MKRNKTGNSAKNLDAAGGEPSRSKVVTAGYPLGKYEKQKIGGFLEQCFLCGKQISTNSDVFMYGDLRAFCSAECRDKQIVKDKPAKGNRATSKEKK